MASLFPGDDIVADPQDEFDALERGVDDFPEDSDLIVVTDDLPPLGRSWRFSFATPSGFTPQTGSLVLQGSGPISTFGVETLKGWIDKVLHTERGAHPIHPPGYGMVAPFDVIGRPFNSVEQASYEGRAVDALSFHPRIAAVRDFVTSFDPDDEILNVAFTVVMDDGSAIPIGVTLP